MLSRHVNVEDVSFENVPSYDWLVNRNGNLLPRSHLWDIFPLVLDSQDYADAFSAAIDNWIFRFDRSFEHFNSDNCWIVSADVESENHCKVGVFCSNGLGLDHVSPRNFAHVC